MAKTNSDKLREYISNRNSTANTSSNNKRNSDYIRQKSFSALQTDLETLSKTIGSVYSGWQTQETMQNTLSSVQSMHDRLGKYQEYQQKYGGADLSQLQSAYKSVLDGWDALSKNYGKYKDAKTYDAENAMLDKFAGMKSSDVQAEIDRINTDIAPKLKTAEELNKRIEDARLGARYNSRNHSESALAEGRERVAKLKDAENELDNYLKSIGYKSLEDLKNDAGGVAYTTVGGENITWNSLYNQKKQKEDSDALYKEISSLDDFEKYKNEGANIKNPTYQDATRGINLAGWRPFADDVENEVEFAKDNYAQLGAEAMFSPGGKDVADIVYSTMTEQERDLYNYHLGKERAGLEAEGSADEYLNSIYGVLKERYENKTLGGLAEYADEHPITASALSVGQNLLSGAEYIKDTANYLFTGELDTNSGAKASSTIRNVVSQKVDWEIGNWDAFDFVYNTGMSMADSVASMALLGGAGGTALGLSAAAQGTNDALERGLDNRKAFMSGLSAGVFEGLFETYSIGKFKALKDAPVDGVKAIIKNVGKSMLTNASEETLTELANLTYDYFANGDLSEAKTSIRAYMSAGLSKEEATKKVALEQFARVGEAGLSGAVMGIGFGGVAGASSLYKSNSKGKTIRSNERVSDMLDLANNPEIGEAYEAYTRYANKGVTADNITNAQLGNLFNTAHFEAYSVLRDKKASEEQKSKAFDTLADLFVVGTENTVAKRAKELNVGEETKVTESGENVKIEGIKVTDEGTSVVTNNGDVALDDITLASNDAELVAFAEQVSKDQGEDIANLFVSQYDGETDVHEYATRFNKVSMLSKYDSVTLDDIIEVKGELSATQATKIYNGVRATFEKLNKESTSKALEKMRNNMHLKGFVDDSIFDYDNASTVDSGRINWNDLNERQRASITFTKGLFSALGNRVVYVGKNKKFNGMYHIEGDTIFIDAYAGMDVVKGLGRDSIIPTASHELTHQMKMYSRETYNEVKEIVLDTLTKVAQLKDKSITRGDIIRAEVERLNERHYDKNHTEEEAIDELIAKACEDMLSVSKESVRFFNSLSEEEQKKLGERIKDILAKLKDWITDLLKSYKSNSEEAKALRSMQDAFDEVSKRWDKMLVDIAEQNKARNEANAETIAENADIVNGNEVTSIGSWDLSEFTEAMDTDGNQMFQYRAMEEDKEVYREMLLKHKKTIGISIAQIEDLFNTIDSAIDIISENLEALDYAWEADIDDRAFSPIKANSDSLYKVSLDFSTLCRKRLLQQTIQATLQETLNKQLSTEEAIAIRDELMKIQEEGKKIEVACALCYVESARMKSLKQITKFLNNRESIIREFFANRSGGSINDKINNAEMKAREELKKANPNGLMGKNDVVLDALTAPKSKMKKADADYIRAKGKEVKASYKLSEHEQAELDVALKMSISDFTTAKGLESLAKNHPDLFDAYTSHVRNATHSKGIENDVWWRAGDSEAIGDNLIAQMNAENGLRSQSWSDFQVIHLLDYIAATIELSAKGAKRQSYTKVPDYVKLLGNTGDMINISLIPERVFEGKLSYDGVEGMAYDIAKQLRDEYHSTVGTICIGINNEQIRMLLEDATIDMVIPYHHSSMSKAVRKLMHIPAWETYQNYQNEKKLSEADAKANAKKYGVKLNMDDMYQKAPKFSDWFNLEEARQIAKMENANPSDKVAYKKYGKMYGGYMAMQNAANKYLKLCAERGLAPKFSSNDADFSNEANYWKLLIDRKMVDNVTGEIIEQKPIKPIFNQNDVLGILNDELERYPQVKADQEYATRKVTQKFLSGEMKMDESTRKAIQTPIDNITEVNILESSEHIADEGKTMHSDRVISVNMSEDERYEILKNKEIDLAEVNTELYEEYLEQIPELLNEELKMTVAKKLLKKIGDEFGVFKEYESKDFNISFEFGKGNLAESVQHQKGNYEIYAQMLSCFSDVISNAVGIEVHNRNEDGYKPDFTLKNVYVLCSAFQNDTDIIPVKLSVKEFSDKTNRLYIAVALEGIKKDRVESAGVQDNLTHIHTSPVTISIKDIFENVNIKDGDFLKYVPNQFLNDEQIKAKEEALENDRKKYFGDTKNSDREDISVYDLMGEADRLSKENESLRADIERLNERLKIEKKVTHGNYFNQNQLGAVAGHLRNISKSNMDKVELMKSLKDVYSFIAQSENLTWEDVFGKCYAIADKMLAESKPEKVIDDYSKHILDDIRSKRISLSDAQKNEAQYIFGKNWNRNFFGRVTITDSGISLEDQWREWADLYPSIFDANITDTDMPGALYDILGSLKEASEMIVEYDESERARWLATEIYNQYWNVSPVRTTADKYDKQIKRLNFEHRNAMKELRDSYDTRLKEQQLADDIHYAGKLGKQEAKYEAELAEKNDRIEKQKELYKNLRDRKDKQIAEAKQKGRERLDKYKENAERKTYIQRITANTSTLNTWLKKNSKDYHIHEAMKGPVIKLLNAVDFSSKQLLEKGEPTQRDASFAEAFAEVKTMLENADNMVVGLESLYGHDLAEDIEKLVKSSYNLVGDNNYVINAMSIDELQSLDKLVRHIKKVVTELNKFHIVNHNQGAVNLAHEFVEHGEKLGKLEKQHGKKEKFLEFRNRTPYYFFKDLGKVGEKLFGAFQDGWDKLAFNAKKIIDFTEETYTDKEVKQWSNETKEFTLSQLDGSERTIEMSVAQIMALYCVSKQTDAQTHLLSGGMTLKRVDKKGHVITDYDNINLTYSDIKSILDTLTDRQREVADKLQEFMNTVCSEWGNEISMARFGVKMFGIPDYFPIKVSEATVPTDNTKDVDNVSLWRLLNMSFTKSRNQNAEQSIEIGDIFDVFAQHSSDMAKYNALALPVLDFNKFYSINGKDMNGKEYGVVKTLKSVFGDEANGYLRRFVRDLNGSQNVSRDVIGNTFFKNAKVASVAANLRVVLLQPTAFHKANAVMETKYLVKASTYLKVEPIGMVKKLKKAVGNAEKYCGIVQWKSLGYYDTDISKGLTEKIKHSDTWKDKFIEKSLKGAELADKATFGTLWIACEFEIRDTRKDLEVGSEEFYNAIAKRLRDVIYATQVVDSTMTRSDMMRSSDGKDKMLTAFGSEPTIAYNMLLDMVTQYKRDEQVLGKKEAKKKNRKKVRKVVTAYVITNAVAALVESGFDVFREDDDEEMDLAEFMKLYLKNFALDMSIGNKLPYVKEVYSTMQGYSSSRMDTQWLMSVNYVIKDITKIIEGEGNWQKFIKDTTKAMSYMSGLPFYNIYRDAMALLEELGIMDD